MTALVSAWTLLKNRGQELDLPPPVETNNERLTPQDLTDRRVDANNERSNLEFEHELSLRDLAGPRSPFESTENYLPMASEQELQEKLLNAGKLSSFAPYDPYYGSDDYRQRLQGRMKDSKLQEEEYENAQRQLDQQTMTREGQQGEADEMDAMGVPDMGRSVGGRAPPNVGRAGSSDTDEEDMASLSPEEITRFQDYNVNQRPNPFPQRTMKSFDAAWKLLKGDYDQDMQQLQMLDGQQTAQAVTQNPPPAAYENNPEGWAEDYMSQMADYQGALSANVGDPNFPLSQLAGMKTQAGEKMDAMMEEHSQREKRLAELKAMGEQMRFEGRPPL